MPNFLPPKLLPKKFVTTNWSKPLVAKIQKLFMIIEICKLYLWASWEHASRPSRSLSSTSEPWAPLSAVTVACSCPSCVRRGHPRSSRCWCSSGGCCSSTRRRGGRAGGRRWGRSSSRGTTTARRRRSTWPAAHRRTKLYHRKRDSGVHGKLEQSLS